MKNFEITATQAAEINSFIQPLRGKFIDAQKAVNQFPALAPYMEYSQKAANPKSVNIGTHYFMFVNDEFHSVVTSDDDAADFLFSTKGSQCFQFDCINGLSVCAYQEKN